jgi:hypothetical protein
MSRPGFWSESVRIWLKACGRQDLVDRGDALAQRVTALLVAVRNRTDQYLEHGDLYSGHGGDGLAPSDPSQASSTIAELEEFVNVRLRQEMAALEGMLAVFDDLRSRPANSSVHEVCESLSSVSDPNLAGFIVTVHSGPSIMATTVTDVGRFPIDLRVSGHRLVFARAPRCVRRRIFSSH